jgi:hypothetical protein
MGVTLPGLTFAATVRMVDWIHHDTAHVRPPTQPPVPAGLPDINIFMIRIPYLSDGCQAGCQDFPHFTRSQPHLNILAVTAHHLRSPTGATNQLPTFSWLQLDIMNRRS